MQGGTFMHVKLARVRLDPTNDMYMGKNIPS